jgi:hypothetical protein
VSHVTRLATAAGDARRNRGEDPLEVLVVPGGSHSWLYEDPLYRRTVARFLAEALGGPYTPDEAGERAAAVDCRRLPEGEPGFAAVAEAPGRLRTLGELSGALRPGASWLEGAGPGDVAPTGDPTAT